jgi:formate hydrogenlyase subunit 5
VARIILALFHDHRGAIDMNIKELLISELEPECKKSIEQGDRMVMVYALMNNHHIELRYLVNQKSNQFMIWKCVLKADEQPISLAPLSPLLGWYEREIMDLFGIKFLGHPEPYALLSCEHKNDPVHGEGLQYLPFGPIRADIVESAEFDYYYAGESIVHFYEKLFFKHRGMESKFCGLHADLGVILAERVSGIGSVSHALAYCQAVEKAAECIVPKRIQYLRIILAELERLYNHLHYFGHLCHATTLKVGASEGCLLEEKLKQINARVTGHRLLRHILTPGGVRRELNLTTLKADLSSLQLEVLQYLERLNQSLSHVDRLLKTGIVSKKLAFDEGATGPVERAAGVNHDLRCDYPYSGYEDFQFKVPVFTEGDAQARAKVRMGEVTWSIQLILAVLEKLTQMPSAELKTVYIPTPNSEGLAWVESPRGGTFYAVHFDHVGKLARVKIKSASYSNWRVFPFTVQGTGMMDFAINEASFGLSVAGCDR